MFTQSAERLIRRVLIAAAVVGLGLGLLASFTGRSTLAQWIWAAGTLPVGDGVNRNDKYYISTFPFMALPHQGLFGGHGQPTK